MGWHIGAVGRDLAGAIGPQGARQLDARVLALLNEYVAVVEGRGVQPHQDFAGPGRGRGHLAQQGRLVNGIELKGTHGGEIGEIEKAIELQF
jgi:hypothetical protein